MPVYSVKQYRSGSRFVVIGEHADREGSWVAFGPATEEACEAFAATAASPVSSLPEPQVWETRENYNQRTGLNVSSVRWTALVGYTVAKVNGRRESTGELPAQGNSGMVTNFGDAS